eukprot:UN14934
MKLKFGLVWADMVPLFSTFSTPPCPAPPPAINFRASLFVISKLYF